MNKFLKHITQLLIAFTFMLTFADKVFSATMYVRLNQPKTPTNQSEVTLSYEALDFLNRPITITCYKKGSSDANFVQFGENQILVDGGNSGTCVAQSLSSGTFEFKVEATAGEDSASATTSVTIDTSVPGDVKDYKKTKTNSCEYTIHFKTADDGGATSKVEVYRSENTSFNVDSGTRVETVSVGSNEEKNVINTIPDCNKTYYYAIRAFDAAGNGSAVIGDSVTITTIVNPTTATQTGAIPVSGTGGTGGGSVLGKSQVNISVTPTGTATEAGEVQGESTASPTPAPIMSLSTSRKAGIVVGLILAALLGYYLWNRRNTIS